MKALVFALFFIPHLIAPPSNAKDIGDEMTLEKLQSLFEVRGEIFTFSENGEVLLEKVPDWMIWRPRKAKDGVYRISRDWSNRTREEPLLAMRQVWQINKDRTITVLIEQFKNEDKDHNFSKLLKTKKFKLKNFEPINWVSEVAPKGKKVVVRFTPSLREGGGVTPVSDLPISGSNITMTDNKGHLWVQNLSITGKYIGLWTHRGTVYLSYHPFPGARPIGMAEGRRLELDLGGNHYVTMRSETNFVPSSSMTQVYGMIRLDRKTRHLGSVRTQTVKEEKEFLDRITKG